MTKLEKRRVQMTASSVARWQREGVAMPMSGCDDGLKKIVRASSSGRPRWITSRIASMCSLIASRDVIFVALA